MNRYLLLLAIIVDLIIGDPRWYPHPVVIIGRGIERLEKFLRKLFSKQSERVAGIILSLIMIISTYLITQKLIDLAYYINYYLGLVSEVWILTTTIAIKGLAQAGKSIYQPLINDNLELARKRLDWIVGRDTDKLTVAEVTRGTIETVAENTSDGIIAPLFYGVVGGAPLAMAYKAINTLDSMLGYKNEEYQYFGWAAASIDDLANWIPARITGLLFVIAALFTGDSWKGAIDIMIRDANKHPSPNAGFPEAAVAGALGIQLGGVNYYQGRESFRAYLGDAKVEFQPQQIRQTIQLMYWDVGAFIVCYSFVLMIV
ncbi:cobalamin biosynthesis protein CobD [Halobacteroides halobius DSM 5150]|uniref:Cobalamin biosynthesis protein CobD n=1 Tax=Halobacteroides halobius (strain ATCC 35273 / DSM 5150 / MD-1) TaxID=748449 RepID=L0K9E9_HALHC|nr:adenosylcobinamide-phosphate synthase CbiB [Halobacteroides halobius]AGB41641.1 cobalamin biosynthesis protein CobD [Halobacteroides halobius DSM 5150]